MTFNQIIKSSLLRDKWTYLSYYLSSVFTVTIFFLFSAVTFHPKLAEVASGSTVGIAMMIASLFIYLFSFLFITYSILAFIKKKLKTYAIYMINGASQKQINQIVFRENFYIGIFSVVSALILGMILFPLFLLVIKKMLQVSLFEFYFPILPIGLTILAFTVLFLVVSKVVTLFVSKKEAITLLKSQDTIEQNSKPAPIRLILSGILTVLMLIIGKVNFSFVEKLDMLYYIVTLLLSLVFLYFLITQSLLIICKGNKRDYYRGTQMLFISNMRASIRSHGKIIYLLSVLMLGVFLCTSILYASYYNTERQTEAVYPYTFQYNSFSEKDQAQKAQDLALIQTTFAKIGPYHSGELSYKTDEQTGVSFVRASEYNRLWFTKKIKLTNNEFVSVSGSQKEPVDNTLITKFFPQQKMSLKKQVDRLLLADGLSQAYFIVSDQNFESLTYPANQSIFYEVQDWKKQSTAIEKLSAEIPTEPGIRSHMSKTLLYDMELQNQSFLAFIGSMLSIIFLSAAVSILYFYLQSTIELEKQKYRGLRKIGLSKKELKRIVHQELGLLIFVPMGLSIVTLGGILVSLRKTLTQSFLMSSLVGIAILASIFTLGYLILSREYFKKLLTDE